VDAPDAGVMVIDAGAASGDDASSAGDGHVTTFGDAGVDAPGADFEVP
jgi:hypothetical protein